MQQMFPEEVSKYPKNQYLTGVSKDIEEELREDCLREIQSSMAQGASVNDGTASAADPRGINYRNSTEKIMKDNA